MCGLMMIDDDDDGYCGSIDWTDLRCHAAVNRDTIGNSIRTQKCIGFEISNFKIESGLLRCNTGRITFGTTGTYLPHLMTKSTNNDSDDHITTRDHSLLIVCEL
jgi:hypothetical protein